MSQELRIVESTLTRPSRWYVVTRYRLKPGIGLDGKPYRYIVASKKYDVTDQMRAILNAKSRKMKRLSDLPCRCTDRTPDGARCRACGGRIYA